MDDFKEQLKINVMDALSQYRRTANQLSDGLQTALKLAVGKVYIHEDSLGVLTQIRWVPYEHTGAWNPSIRVKYQHFYRWGNSPAPTGTGTWWTCLGETKLREITPEALSFEMLQTGNYKGLRQPLPKQYYTVRDVLQSPDIKNFNALVRSNWGKLLVSGYPTLFLTPLTAPIAFASQDPILMPAAEQFLKGECHEGKDEEA